MFVPGNNLSLKTILNNPGCMKADCITTKEERADVQFRNRERSHSRLLSAPAVCSWVVVTFASFEVFPSQRSHARRFGNSRNYPRLKVQTAHAGVCVLGKQTRAQRQCLSCVL